MVYHAMIFGSCTTRLEACILTLLWRWRRVVASNWASIKLLQDDHSSAFVGKDCGDCCSSLCGVVFCCCCCCVGVVVAICDDTAA